MNANVVRIGNLVNVKDKQITVESIDETGINSVYTGNVLMQGSEYDNWTDNDYAWDYVAMELGIEFISN